MNKKLKPVFFTLLVLWFIGDLAWYLHAKNFAVLNPAGMVASQERRLLLMTVILGVLVVVPVYIMTFAIAWRYREGNKKSKYSPELSGNTFAELVWWGIPIIIIGTLSVITWQTSHALDPHRGLKVTGKPLTIDVVALDWKWLFIYPEQGIASVNQVDFPAGTPVTFNITSDAPMNSFWIPQLGGQIYAMPGMSTQLHLIADKAGSYQGLSANISGAGFAGMRFTADAGSQAAFDSWVQTAHNTPAGLSMDTYDSLVQPSQDNPVTLYSSVDSSLYDSVLLKYMAPQAAEGKQ